MRATLSNLKKVAGSGEKIAVLTCYDASFATLLESAGVDVLLVGDSLGMVVQGEETTLPVSMADMVYHTRCVVHGTQQAFVIADMPFGSYQQGPARAFANAAKLMAAGAQMVKLEGGAALARQVTQQLTIPTIGIGAGPDCSGQVLVLYDLLGIYPGKPPKFARNFLTSAGGIQSAVEQYVKAVKSGEFPAPEHCF